ncbi:hypothetical protein ACWD0A_29345 [Streptomyces sp. NPDC002867]
MSSDETRPGPTETPAPEAFFQAFSAGLASCCTAERQLQSALTQAASWRAEPVADIGEWAGGRVDDPDDDFACRYMYAFWRLVAQGVTTTQAPAH